MSGVKKKGTLSATNIPDKISSRSSIGIKRRLNLISGVGLIVGTIVGSGIFISPGPILKQSGSVGLSLVIWLVCGLISLTGALCYAELGTMNNSNGGEFAYFMDAYGPLAAFLFSWVSNLVMKPGQAAIIILTFGHYFVKMLTSKEVSDIPVKLTAIALCQVLVYINCVSVPLVTKVQNAFTFMKLVAIVVVCALGLYYFVSSFFQNIKRNYYFGFENSTYAPLNISLALYGGLWAYDGWNNLNYATGELHNPSRNLPLAISIAIPLVTLNYICVYASYLFVLSSKDLISTNAVAIRFADRVLSLWKMQYYLFWFIPLCIALSAVGAANGTIFSSSRLCYATSMEGQFPEIMAYLHKDRGTPVAALIFQGIITIIMIATGDLDSLINYFSFTAWIFYGAAFLAVIVLRYTQPKKPRPYKVFILAPIFGVILSVFLVIVPLVRDPRKEYMLAVGFIIIGLPYYYFLVHSKRKVCGKTFVLHLLQKLLIVIPVSSLRRPSKFISCSRISLCPLQNDEAQNTSSKQ